MPIKDTIRKAGTAAGAATAAAPYVRRLMTDSELRSTIKDLAALADRLYNELSDDDRLRDGSVADTLKQGAERVADSVQHTARKVTGAERREREKQARARRRMVFAGAGLGVALLGLLAAALLYPRSRKSLTQAAGQTRAYAGSTVRGAGERAAHVAGRVKHAA